MISCSFEKILKLSFFYLFDAGFKVFFSLSLQISFF